MVFGIVVEGETDSVVYRAMIQRIRPDVDIVLSQPCQGVAGVRRMFVGWLKHFQWHSAYQVGKALVIRDSDCDASRALEDELGRILDQSGFREKLTLPVHFYATRCMVETWLLADESAVNAVARERGKIPAAQPVPDPLEGATNAKVLFRRMLSHAQLRATPAVYAEVAAAADIDRIKQRCPYFQRFIDCVHGC
jgi:hypothetical protein